MKKMKKLIVCFAICMAGLSVSAQLKQLTVEEAVLQARTTLAPKKLTQLSWIKGTTDYAFINDKEVLMRGKAMEYKAKEVLSLTALNRLLKEAGIDSMKKFPAITWKSSQQFEFKSGNKNLGYDFQTNKVGHGSLSSLPEAAENVDKAVINNKAAYVLDNNLYIDNSGKQIKITTDGSSDLVYGKSVHREEFGITKGTFWSNDANKLAFYRMDQSMVTDYPLVDYAQKPAKEKLIKYPMAGDKSHHVTVGVYDLTTSKTVYLKTGEPAEQYLSNIAWSPDNKYVFIAVVNRQQNHTWLNQYESATGNFVKTLFEETDDKYTEPLHPVEFLPKDASKFIWQSRKDGFNHIYLYEASGKLIRQLTKGNWEVIDVAGFSNKGDKIFFTATINGAINRDFCSVDVKTGQLTRITTLDGTHVCSLSDNGAYIIDNFTSNSVPRIITIYNTTTLKQNVLLVADNPLKDYNVGKTKIFTLKSESGDDLYCRMITPPAFDSTKKYPVFVYVYGGPHLQLVTNSWLGGADLWNHVLAAKGYIIFTLDNRGTANRGKAFEQTVFRRLGTVEMEDQITGVNYLKSLNYVDASRIGVDGWSYGGFMTVSLMTRKPGTFKVGVAGGTVMDWRYYEVMYTERYMDTPQENKEGYESSTLANYIDNLQGKMLLIHGSSDETVVWQHSLMYLKEAVTKGKQVDYFVYPGHLHNVHGKERVHLITKIINYFDENL